MNTIIRELNDSELNTVSGGNNFLANLFHPVVDVLNTASDLTGMDQLASIGDEFDEVLHQIP